MTTHEARLTAQLATLTEKIDALQQQRRGIQSQLDALHRREHQTRLLAVTKLVDAAGLLHVDEGTLEKLLRQLAEQARQESDHG